ncbi:MAG: TrmH family RNA methyltransferase [Desulfurococcaceae archaeon]
MKIRVVLVGIEGSYNLGVIIRTCKNFGVEEIYLVSPKANLDEANHYVAKASDLLRRVVIVDSLEKALEDVEVSVATSALGFSDTDMVRQAVSIEDFIKMIHGRTRSLAIVFGRESTGLTRNEILKTDYLVTIPANPEYPVLNISQSVAIFLWEIWKIRGAEAPNIPPRISRDDLELLLSKLREIVELTVGVDYKVERIITALKRVFYRAKPSIYEYRVIKYWVLRTLKKLRETRG